MFFSDDIKGKKLLLHACCGPCSLGAIQPLLDDGAVITLFYYNPCILYGEFDLRLEALRTTAEHYGLPLVVPEQSYGHFIGYAEPYSAEPEGGARCEICMEDRLFTTAAYCKAHGFDCYSTTLTVSPHKNSKLVFSVAEGIGGGEKFYARDFKKRDGFKLSCALTKELGIYRQSFCGCEYSYENAMRRERERAKG